MGGKSKHTSICEHFKRRSRCSQCGGGEICPHSKIKSRCLKCKETAKNEPQSEKGITKMVNRTVMTAARAAPEPSPSHAAVLPLVATVTTLLLRAEMAETSIQTEELKADIASLLKISLSPLHPIQFPEHCSAEVTTHIKEPNADVLLRTVKQITDEAMIKARKSPKTRKTIKKGDGSCQIQSRLKPDFEPKSPAKTISAAKQRAGVSVKDRKAAKTPAQIKRDEGSPVAITAKKQEAEGPVSSSMSAPCGCGSISDSTISQPDESQAAHAPACAVGLELTVQKIIAAIPPQPTLESEGVDASILSSNCSSLETCDPIGPSGDEAMLDLGAHGQSFGPSTVESLDWIFVDHWRDWLFKKRIMEPLLDSGMGRDGMDPMEMFVQPLNMRALSSA